MTTSDFGMHGSHYVAGFVFNYNRDKVLLIQKKKPVFQYNKLNGIGGRIEKGESPYDAMVREFKEEAGVELKNWQEGCVLIGYNWCVFFFYIVLPHSLDRLEFRSMTSELVRIVPYPYQRQIGDAETLANCPLMMAACLDETTIKPSVIYDKELQFCTESKIAKSFHEPISASRAFECMGQVLAAIQE